MRIHEIITENFKNLFIGDTEKRQKYAQTLYDMVQASYARIGGMKGSGFNRPEDMIERLPMWKIFTRDMNVKAAAFYKDKNGRKRVAVATDGTPEGKSILARIMADDATSGRAYSEISGPSLAFHKKILGEPALDNITINTEHVIKILGSNKDDIRAINDFEYERNINGDWITKRMIGKPGNRITS